MKRRGYVLVEVLLAVSLLMIAGAGVTAGLAQGIRAERKIRKIDALYDPFKFLWLGAAKDLRNALALRDCKFAGEADRIEFATYANARLARVRYFTEGDRLVRSEEGLPEKFVKERPARQVLLTGVEKVEFQFAYLDEETGLVFKSVWPDEPYWGIPKAVKLNVKLKDNPKVFSRLIPIPQGRWGHE